MAVERIQSPEIVRRRVLFAVELVDPVTRSLVYRGLTVRAEGLANQPIMSLSGRFVWLFEGNAWPRTISVIPRGAPYQPHEELAPPRPPDLEQVTPAERLVTIVLRPTRSYVLDAGVTGIRGRLRESSSTDSPPVVAARVQLAWHNKGDGIWLPPVPEPSDNPEKTSPRAVETDADGEFAVFLRLNPAVADVADFDKEISNLLAVRLQITRAEIAFETRITSPRFPFLGADKPTGRVPEGQLLAKHVTLAWSELSQLN